MHYKFRFLKKIVLVLLGAAALGWVVMSLWNWIIPSLFTDVHSIDYLKALGLLVLCKILFGGFHGRGGWHHHHHMQRFEKMTTEEKEKFRQAMMGFRSHHHHKEYDSSKE